MEQLYILRYSNGSEWKTGVSMTLKVARKQAELLSLNGYEVEIVPVDLGKTVHNTSNIVIR